MAGSRPADELARARDRRHRERPPLPPRAPYPRRPAGPAPVHPGRARSSPPVWPERGRSRHHRGAAPAPLTVDYQYGFSARVGAGPYDRDLLGDPPPPVHRDTTVSRRRRASTPRSPRTPPRHGHDRRLPHLRGARRRRLDRGRSSRCSSRAGPGHAAGAAPGPGGRSPSGSSPAAAGRELILDGLHVSGCDIVLRGAFDSSGSPPARSTPGPPRPGSPPLATAVDGSRSAPAGSSSRPTRPPPASGRSASSRRPLHPRADPHPVRRLGRDDRRSPTASSRASPRRTGTAYTAADVFDPALLARGLARPGRPAARPRRCSRRCRRPARRPRWLRAPSRRPGQQAGSPPLDGLNALVGGPPLYDPASFATVSLSAGVQALAAGRGRPTDAAGLAALNRGLLDESFPVALGVAALAVADATVSSPG